MHVEYNTRANRPILYCFPWGEDKRALMRETRKPYYNVMDFEPYFYVHAEDIDPPGAVRVEPGFEALDGTPLKKVVATVPAEVPVLRTDHRHYSADVLFPARYVIDRIPELPATPPDLLYLDIEMAAARGVPDPLNPVDPIVTLSTYLTSLRRFLTFSWHPAFEPEKVEHRGAALLRYPSERAMLEGFATFVRRNWPDVWVGWNLINFDVRCIYGRMVYNHLKPGLLSPMDDFWISRDKEPVLKGTVLFDLLAAYRAFKNRDFDSLSLEATAQRELGEGKRPMDKSRMAQAWRDRPADVEEYCRSDVELIVRIDRKLRLLDFWTEVHRETGVLLGDIIDWKRKKLHGAHVVETYVMRNSEKVLMSHGHGGPASDLEGAAMLEPVRGVHRNIVAVDDPSKYPSIMATFNLSPDTVLHYRPDAAEGTEIRADAACYMRHEDHLGEIPRIVEKLFAKKDEYHDLRSKQQPGSDEWKLYDRRRYVYKQLLNAFQGASSQPSSRIYNAAIANDITWAGREMLGIAARTVHGLGYDVLAGHTDSVFFHVETDDLQEQLRIGTKVAAAVTAGYRRWVRERGVSGPWVRVRSELAGVASAGFLSRKTMHALKWRWEGDMETGRESGEVEVKGFQAIRSDYPPILRRLMDAFLHRLLEGEDPHAIARDLQPEIDRVARGEVPALEVAIPKGLQKAIGTYRNHSPWDKGAQWANKHIPSVRFTQGSKPRLLYVKAVPPGTDATEVVCIESEADILEGIDVDWRVMAEKVRAGFKSVIEALGLNAKTFLTDQRELEAFA